MTRGKLRAYGLASILLAAICRFAIAEWQVPVANHMLQHKYHATQRLRACIVDCYWLNEMYFLLKHLNLTLHRHEEEHKEVHDEDGPEDGNVEGIKTRAEQSDKDGPYSTVPVNI